MATTPKTHLAITGLRCASCVQRVRDALMAVKGVEDATVNLADRSAEVSGQVEAAALIAAVETTGYHASVFHDPKEALLALERSTRQEYREKLQRTVIAFAIGLPLTLRMGHAPLLQDNWDALRIQWTLIGLVTLAAMLASGWHFYRGAAKGVLTRSATMDTLISMGTLAAWGYSMTVVLFPAWFPVNARHLYFEAAIAIIALVNLGSLLESRVRSKAQTAIRELIELQPAIARIVTEEGERDIAILNIRPGDIIQLRPGDTVPVDGVISLGQVNMDESLLTGEYRPVTRTVGGKLHTGSRCMAGTAQLRATHIGEETALAEIIRRVREAQNTRPPIANQVDKISSVFVPVVILIALLAATVWMAVGPSPRLTHSLISLVTVLIIACPCALGLAVPMSIMMASNLASRHGILIRDGAALQMASRLTTLIFDKTGTVTEGRGSVTRLQPLVDSLNADALLRLAAAVEHGSEHAFAQAVMRAAEERAIPVPACTEFQSISGQGVQGIVEGQTIIVGNAVMMRNRGIALSDAEMLAQIWADDAVSPMYLATDGKLLGLLGVSDTIKEDARRAIGRLKQIGIRVMLLSGDHPRQCAAVAKQLNIDEFLGGMLPDQKLEVIHRQQLQGEVVGMVGDGINDAPALAAAEVGFAVGKGTDVAIAASGITLTHTSLDGIFSAIRISRATLTNIQQNLFAAFLYNVIAIPVAAGVLFPLTGWQLNPVIAAGAMAASSLSVVLNAARLRSTQLS